MGYNIAFPNITGYTSEQQLSQIKEYLFGLTNTLNRALSSIDGISSDTVVISSSANASSAKDDKSKKAEATFGEIRDLIINSADIVEAYSEMIQKRLQYKYVAESDFGTYINQTFTNLEATARAITAIIKDEQSIIGEKEVSTVTVNGYIKTGIIGEKDGKPKIGIAIGQTTETDGSQTFKAAMEITSDRISFLDENSFEVAYLSNSMLYISRVEITDFIRLGGYDVDTSDGVAWKWRSDNG